MPAEPFDTDGYAERLAIILDSNPAGQDLGMVRSLLRQAIDLYGREIQRLKTEVEAARAAAVQQCAKDIWSDCDGGDVPWRDDSATIHADWFHGPRDFVLSVSPKPGRARCRAQR